MRESGTLTTHKELGAGVQNVFCLGDLGPEICPSLLQNMALSNIQNSVLSFKKV